MTPLRYPGGKAKLTPFIKNIIEQNNLKDGSYVEPFAGGAGIAINLLLASYVDKIYINDIHKGLYAFWKTILNDTDNFCKKIYSTAVNMQTWQGQKNIFSDANSSEFDLAFSTFFLNRTNYSGILKGGVVGGKNQDGKYKIGSRFNKENLIKRIENIAKYKGKIDIYNLDAIDFLDKISPLLNSKSLIYLDPPYYVKGKGLYINYYDQDDHRNIANYVSNLNTPWLVSYDNHKEIVNLYKDYDSQVLDINYSANNKSKSGQEIFFHPKYIFLPK